ncbi:hypothetical protein [Streptomyces sp. NPDC020747]|uniref:hypothetical protein n=1 Tax=Streptomyces sp. NPDC020747 TaxID=3365086 RepID=UPI0037B21F50
MPKPADPVRERVLEESHGNPLALIESGAAQEAGHHDLAEQVGPLLVTGRVQEAFRAQLAGLPDATRAALLAAAADGAASLDVVLRVAARLGVGPADLAPAEQAHLITVADRALTFRHPLIRAAAYQLPPHHQRAVVHEQFAREWADNGHLDRRAWHLAAAATGPDEEVADELERTALRAQYRGGAMAVSAAYDRAARLSIDGGRKATRLSLAAQAEQAAFDAGRADRAARPAAEAESYADDPRIKAEAMFVRAQVEYDRTSPAADAELAMPRPDSYRPRTWRQRRWCMHSLYGTLESR